MSRNLSAAAYRASRTPRPKRETGQNRYKTLNTISHKRTDRLHKIQKEYIELGGSRLDNQECTSC